MRTIFTLYDAYMWFLNYAEPILCVDRVGQPKRERVCNTLQEATDFYAEHMEYGA